MTKDKQTTSPLYILKKYRLRSIARSIFSHVISDTVVMSYRKSGRTWLRLMYAKILQDQYNIKKIKLDTEYMTLFKSLPNVMFSQGGSTKTENNVNFQKIYAKKKIILMIRDPRATLVSLYHDYNSRKVWTEPKTMSEFIRDEKYGLTPLITFMNNWADECKKRHDILILKYEDLYLQPETEMKRFLDHINLKADDTNIKNAIEFGSAKNMRKMEEQKTFNDKRMLPANKDDPNSYTARKCKLGSFKEELLKEDLEYITTQMKERLDSFYDYTQSS